ncbi:MAG TPA: hypothetical protein PLX35_02970 [Cyclobacteriaceae bacterium]|nr:hypothetical protein [Cyclobacteriaceae bacterium]HQQ96192.1 hypothetical protein [Cyclobacteriaceae bacterium]
MAVFLLTLAIFGLFFALMSVRLIFIKNGEFRGTCATQSPYLAKEGITCGYCGKTIGAGESCPNADEKEPALAPLPDVRNR